MAFSFSSTLRRGIRYWNGATSVQRWRLVLAALALFLLIVLIAADSPWRTLGRIQGNWKIEHYGAFYTWWATLANIGVLGVLAWICPWWAGKSIVSDSAPARPATPKYFLPAVAIAVLVAGFFASQRLDHSLWDDEEYNMRRSILGSFELNEKTGVVELKRLSWEETFFEYRKPNNHVLHSALARMSLTAWSWFNADAELPFSETALRIPAFLFGLLCVAVVGLMLREFGFARAGVVAAFLLAIHPWFLRYASEARGYSLIMLAMLLLVIFARRAIIEGTWKWWAAFSAAQFAMLYTYPAMLPIAVLLNLLVLGLLWTSKEAAGPAWTQAGRWFICSAFAGMLALRQMLPLMPQFLDYLHTNEAAGKPITYHWLQNAGNYFLAGLNWRKSSEDIYPMMSLYETAHPVFYAIMAAVMVGLLVLGTVRLGWGNRIRSGMAFLIFAAPLALLLQAKLQDSGLYEWYLVFAVPGWVALVAAGAVWLGSARWMQRAWMLPSVALLVAYAVFTHMPRTWMVENPLEQIRASVASVRPTLKPNDPAQAGLLTVSFNVPPYVYDAHMLRARTVEDFIAYLERADATGLPLYVNIGHPATALGKHKPMWDLMIDPELFEDAEIFYGLDPSLDRMVARYIPGSWSRRSGGR